MTICTHRTTACAETPTRSYRVWPTGTVTNLCDPCAAVLRSLGMDLREDAIPEWRRRLVARDMTGALRS
jgi:hypothetical protein